MEPNWFILVSTGAVCFVLFSLQQCRNLISRYSHKTYVAGYVYQECKGYRVLAARPPALLLL